MTIVVRSYRDEFRDRRRVLIADEFSDGRRAIAKPLVLEIVERGALIEEATVEDGDQFLQAALNHAWSIGMRPAGFNDTTQQVAALTDHLNDMRALVFKVTPSKRP